MLHTYKAIQQGRYIQKSSQTLQATRTRNGKKKKKKKKDTENKKDYMQRQIIQMYNIHVYVYIHIYIVAQATRCILYIKEISDLYTINYTKKKKKKRKHEETIVNHKHFDYNISPKSTAINFRPHSMQVYSAKVTKVVYFITKYCIKRNNIFTQKNKCLGGPV